jgi:hypothetical protein
MLPNRCNDPLDVRDCSCFPLQLGSGRVTNRYICVPLRVPRLSRQKSLGYQDRFGARSFGQIRHSSGQALANLPMGTGWDRM